MITKRGLIRLALGWLCLVCSGIAVSGGVPDVVVGRLVTGNDVVVSGLPAEPGLTLLSGDTLKTGGEGSVIMVGGANRIALGTGAEVSFDRLPGGVVIRLVQGGLNLYHPEKEKTQVQLNAGDASIIPASGFATEADVLMTDQELIVSAKEGLLSVEAAGHKLQLPPGQAIKLTPTPHRSPGAGPAAAGVVNAGWEQIAGCAAVGAAAAAVPLGVADGIVSPYLPGAVWAGVPAAGTLGGLGCTEPPRGDAPPPPPSCTLVYKPAEEFGKLPTLSYTSENAIGLNLQPGVGVLPPPAGVTPITPPMVGTTEYVMTAIGRGGVGVCKVNVTVDNPSCTITASPNKVYQQDFIKLSWTALAAVGNVDIEPAPGPGQPQTGVVQVRAPAGEGEVTYKATVNGYGGKTATCQATVDVGVKSAIPVSLVQTSATVMGNGTNDPKLRFRYTWESSTGSLSDLANCRVGEIVAYASGANPYDAGAPFRFTVPDPTVIWLAGIFGRMVDTNSAQGFRQPHQEATFTATQYFRYECRCSDGTTRKGNLMGPISIVRRVTQNADGGYTYMITKSGSRASGLLP